MPHGNPIRIYEMGNLVCPRHIFCALGFLVVGEHLQLCLSDQRALLNEILPQAESIQRPHVGQYLSLHTLRPMHEKAVKIARSRQGAKTPAIKLFSLQQIQM